MGLAKEQLEKFIGKRVVVKTVRGWSITDVLLRLTVKNTLILRGLDIPIDDIQSIRLSKKGPNGL